MNPGRGGSGTIADQNAVLAITRIRFKHAWHLPLALLKFHRQYKVARRESALVRGQVSVVDLRTVVNVSIWTHRWAMLQWSATDDHIDAVRWTYQRADEVWSADWVLNRLSRSANAWS